MQFIFKRTFAVSKYHFWTNLGLNKNTKMDPKSRLETVKNAINENINCSICALRSHNIWIPKKARMKFQYRKSSILITIESNDWKGLLFEAMAGSVPSRFGQLLGFKIRQKPTSHYSWRVAKIRRIWHGLWILEIWFGWRLRKRLWIKVLYDFCVCVCFGFVFNFCMKRWNMNSLLNKNHAGQALEPNYRRGIARETFRSPPSEGFFCYPTAMFRLQSLDTQVFFRRGMYILPFYTKNIQQHQTLTEII